MAVALIAGITGWALWWTSRQDAGVVTSSRDSTEIASSAEQQSDPAAPVTLPLPPGDQEERSAELPTVHLPAPDSLSPARALVVTVVDERGQTVPGALIEVWNVPVNEDFQTWLKGRVDGQPSREDLERLAPEFFGRSGEPIQNPPTDSLQADESGRCTITTPMDSIILVASKADVGTSGWWRSKAETDALVLELRRTARIHGIVRGSDRRPIAHAEIAFDLAGPSVNETRPRPPKPILSDDQGAFSVTVDAPMRGRVHARIEADDEMSAETFVSVEPGDDRQVEIDFAGAYSISGVVVNDLAQPVTSARINVECSWSRDGDYVGARASVKTGQDGTFWIDLAQQGSYMLDVVSADWVVPQLEPIEVSTLVPHAEVVIRCEASSVLAGRVLWDDGDPVSGAIVTAHAQTSRYDQDVPDPPTCWSTEKDGSFELNGVRSAYPYTLVARRVLPALVETTLRDVQPGTPSVVIVLSRKDAEGVVLRGRVIEMETGVPVTRFEVVHGVWNTFLRGNSSMGKRSAWYDSQDGRFEIPRLQADRKHLIEIRAAGFEPAVFGAISAGGETETEFQIGHVGGMAVEVIDEGGQPATGAVVALFNEATMDGNDLSQAERKAVSDADARVSWDGLVPGSRWLIAGHASGRVGPTRVTVPSGGVGQLTVQLSTALPKGSVRLELLDQQRRPLAGIEVNVLLTDESALLVPSPGQSEPDEKPVTTDASGVATAEHLLPGIYAVSVYTDELSIVPRLVILQPGASVTVELRQ